MRNDDLRELQALLWQQGLRAEVCDTPVPVSLAGVPCGIPSELGDECIDDYVLLPKKLVGQYPEMFVPAIGDSMVNAGYESGDRLRIRFGMQAHDSCDVLAMIDGACTVKTLFTDEEGTTWLVPQNEKYDAIQLTEGMDVRILGVVVGVEKASIRTSSRELLQSIRRTKNKQRSASRLSNEKVDRFIIRMGGEVKHARQWYAVFRAMVDYGVADESGIGDFCDRVRRLLPEHGHLPVRGEVQRMAVQSFAKRVSMWNPDNAPVVGSRYRDYLNVALKMGRLLGGEEI